AYTHEACFSHNERLDNRTALVDPASSLVRQGKKPIAYQTTTVRPDEPRHSPGPEAHGRRSCSEVPVADGDNWAVKFGPVTMQERSGTRGDLGDAGRSCGHPDST
ncbi:hypothetical protein BD309DRAFT_873220, partial [Dichomitus squalens]